MRVVPLQAKPAQSISVVLGGQSCKIVLRHKSTGLFFDLYIDDRPVVLCRICLDRTRLIRQKYFGFSGDLFFVDTQGTNDPEYNSIGTRYLLMYVTDEEMS